MHKKRLGINRSSMPADGTLVTEEALRFAIHTSKRSAYSYLLVLYVAGILLVPRLLSQPSGVATPCTTGDYQVGLADGPMLPKKSADESVRNLRHTLSEQPNSIELLTQLARLLGRENKQIAALYYWKCAAALDPSNLQLLLSVATSTADLGDLESALKELRAITASNPQFELAIVEMGEVLCRLGDYTKGIEELRKALELNPADSVACMSLGKALLSLNRYADASREVVRCVADHPDNGEAHDLLGIAYLGADQLGAAEREFRKAMVFDARVPDLNRNLGVSILRQGRPEEALAYLDHAVSEKPDDPDMHFLRMQAYKALHRSNAAKSEATQVAELKYQQARRDRVSQLAAQARELAKSNRLTDALETYRDALNIDPHDGDVRYQAAVIEDDLGQMAEEEEDLHQAETERTIPAAVHNQLGTVEIRKGEYTEAKRELQLAIAESPDYYAALGNLGVVYANLGDRERAIECFERATELNPEYKQGYLNLGFMFSAIGNRTLAERALQTVLEIDPSDPRAPTLRREIAEMASPSSQ